MILKGLTRKIKARFIQNYEEDEDKLYVTDGNGEVKSIVANNDEEKARLNAEQNKLIKKYNKKYRSKIRKRGIVFAGLAIGLVLSSIIAPILLPTTIATSLFALSGLAAAVAATTVMKEYEKKLDTMDAQDYYLNEENKDDIDSFTKSDICKHFSLQKKSPYKYMANKLIKSTNEKEMINPLDFYYNGVTKWQLEQAKKLCELAKEYYRNNSAEEISTEDMDRESAYQYTRL